MEVRRLGESVTYDTRAEAHEQVDKQKRYAQIMECLSEKPMTAKECAVELFTRGYAPTAERNLTGIRGKESEQCISCISAWSVGRCSIYPMLNT